MKIFIFSTTHIWQQIFKTINNVPSRYSGRAVHVEQMTVNNGGEGGKTAVSQNASSRQSSPLDTIIGEARPACECLCSETFRRHNLKYILF